MSTEQVRPSTDAEGVREHAAAVAHWLVRERLAMENSLAMRLIRDEVPAILAELASLTTERDQLRGEVERLHEHDRIRAQVIADHQGRLIAAAELAQDYMRVMTERDAVQALLVEEQRGHAATREELARKSADADRSWRLLADARTATKRLTAGLIANAGLLDVPFTNEPELSPWSRSIKPAINGLRMALGMRGAVRLPCCDLHNRNCEPPSELCCEHCTEAAHPGHADGSVCIAPDLSSAPLAAVDALDASAGPGEEGGSDGR